MRNIGMRKIDQFEIEFDKKPNVFSPGSVVSGHVSLHLVDFVHCDAVIVQFRGSARTFWTESSSLDGKTRRSSAQSKLLKFQNHKIYYDHRDTVWSPEKSGARTPPRRGFHHQCQQRPSLKDKPKLEIGTHQWSFEFSLPENAPTSFNAAAGFVDHFVNVMLTADGRVEHSRKEYFSVVRPVPLDAVEFGVPTSETGSLKLAPSLLSCINRTTGQVKVTLTLDKTGFVPGEKISVTFNVENGGFNSLKFVNLALRQHVVCFGSAGTIPGSKKATNDMEKVFQDLASGTKNKSDPFYSVELQIPSIAPTFQEAGIMQAYYTLCAELGTKRDKPLVTVELPVTIGTEPIENDLLAPLPSAGSGEPSFEECIVTRKGSCAVDKWSNLPKYPVFNFSV